MKWLKLNYLIINILRYTYFQIENQKLAELQEPCITQSTNLTTSDLSINGLDNSDQQCIISQSKNINRLEWILLATAIDRLSFLLFCTIFTITAIAYVRVNNDAFSKNLNIINFPATSENLTSADYF